MNCSNPQVKEILAGDKQLAKEIEFDLRRFDQEQWEEEERVDEVELGGNQETEKNQEQVDSQAKGDGENDGHIESVGSSPLLVKRISTPGKEKLISTSGSASKTSVNSRNELKQALLTSRAVLARRKSISVPYFNLSDESSHKSSSGMRQRRASCSDFREKNNETSLLVTPEKEKNNEDLCPHGSSPDDQNNTNLAPQKGKTREDLMRAISTPQAEKSVISNITFVNETQELSAISMDLSHQSNVHTKDGRQPKLLLHLKSPEAYAKESEFSRLRKSTRRDLRSDLNKVGKDQTKETRKSGGLFESCVNEVTDSEDESAIQSRIPTPTDRNPSKTQKLESRPKVKRTRDVASLSPDPTKVQPHSATPKPSKKKSRTRSK